MAASELTVRKRVTEILNACSPGTYSEAVDVNYFDRNSQAIRQAVKEGAYAIARAIVVNPRHAHRGVFVSNTPTEFVISGAELPDMAGEMDLVEVQPYSGAAWRTGALRDIQQIESFVRDASSVPDERVYSEVKHNAKGSPLGGYYAIHNNRIYFSGYKARGYYPVISASDVITKIPDEYEGTWVALAIARCIKEGDNLADIAAYYNQLAMADLSTVTVMGMTHAMPTVEEARSMRGNA